MTADKEAERRRLLILPAAQHLLNFALSFVGVIFVLAVIILVGRDILWRTIDIEPISAPKTLTDEGYGPEIVARRLQDAVNNISFRIQRTSVQPSGRLQPQRSLLGHEGLRDVGLFDIPGQHSDILLQTDLPKIVAPDFGATLELVCNVHREVSGSRPTSDHFRGVHSHQEPSLADP